MTLKTATKYLKKFFPNSIKEVSVQDVYINAGLDMSNPDKNRSWLGNKMTYMKRHDLIEPKYTRKNNSTVLIGLKLTDKGAQILNGDDTSIQEVNTTLPQKEIQTTSNGNHTNGAISLKDVASMLSELKGVNPQSKIGVDIKLKEGIVSINMP